MKHNILLAFSFAKRDFKERYVGTGLGQFWFVLSPIIMIAIYSAIFSSVMKMKLDIVDSSYAYSIYLIPGILAWTAFNTIISRLNNSFAQKAGLLKKINVPMYTFQLSILITEFFILALSMALAICFLIIVDFPISINFLYLIPMIILQVLFSFSVGVILSLFTPFFKDLKVAVPIVLQLWFWMSPIVYMKEMIEDKYPFILVYNPFFYFVDTYHNIFLFSKAPSLEYMIIIISMTTVTFSLAAYLYTKMTGTIKDII